MEYRNFGKAGVKVSPICLGTAFRGSRKDEALCIRTIERALDLGCNFVDCANVYGTEHIVGKALKGKRDDVVLTSISICCTSTTTARPLRRACVHWTTWCVRARYATSAPATSRPGISSRHF